jgi:hypothetical protein
MPASIQLDPLPRNRSTERLHDVSSRIQDLARECAGKRVSILAERELAQRALVPNQHRPTLVGTCIML